MPTCCAQAETGEARDNQVILEPVHGHALDKKAWFAGTPEETTAYLKDIEEKYPGVAQVMIGFPMGETKAQFKEQLTRCAKGVIPACKGAAITA